MNESAADLAHKRLLGFIWLFFICFFNTIPLFALSFLANLDSVRPNLVLLQLGLAWARSNPMFRSCRRGSIRTILLLQLYLVYCLQLSLGFSVSSSLLL